MNNYNKQGISLDSLQEKAKNDSSRIYFISPTSKVDLTGEKRFGIGYDDRPQVHLNPMNKKTLLVVPMNDDETKEIERIARSIELPTLKVEGKHGLKLTQKNVDEIIKTAKKNKLSKIMIVEIPPPDLKNLRLEREIRRRGFDLKVIDHHNYGYLERWKPVSSLDQFTLEIGYKMSFSSKVIATLDAQYLLGLKELGFSENMIIKDFVMKRIDPQVVSSLQSNTYLLGKNSWGPLVLVKDSTSTIGDAYGVVMDKTRTLQTNIMKVFHDGFYFIGTPRVVHEVYKKMNTIKTEGLVVFEGGDNKRSMFVDVKNIPENLRVKFFMDFVEVLDTQFKISNKSVFKNEKNLSEAFKKVINKNPKKESDFSFEKLVGRF